MTTDHKIDIGSYMRYDLSKWNRKLYGNWDTEVQREVDHSFWKEFGIATAPGDTSACWSHIPVVWEEDVRIMLKTIRDEFGKSVVFHQIKEKFCMLAVYFDADDDKARARIEEIVEQCRSRLIAKDLHPRKKV